MKSLFLNKLVLLGFSASLMVGCASTTPEAHYERNKDKSLAQLMGQEELSEAEKAEQKAQWLTTAQIALDAEQYEQAGKTVKKVLAVDPVNFEARYILAEIKLSEDPATALEYYSILHETRPSPETLQGIGLAQIGSGRLEQGRKTLKQALALSPDLWRAHNAIGVTHAMKNEWAEAELSYLTASELNPENPDVYSNLAQIYIRQKRYQTALEVFTESSSKTTGNDRFNLTYRWALALNDQHDRALYGLNEEQSATLMNHLGESALLENDYPRAVSYFKSALKVHPSYFPDADQNLQFALRQMKMP